MNELIIPETMQLVPEVAQSLAEFEKAVKVVTKKRDDLRGAILKEMEKNGIIKLETPEVDITYIAGTDRESFNGTAFKAEYPEQYDRYVTMKPVKPSVRVKVK